MTHKDYRGRRPIHFFMKREDAEALLRELVDENVRLKDQDIIPVRVKLLHALRGIAADTDPDNADGFVVHSPNEVYEYIRDRA